LDGVGGRRQIAVTDRRRRLEWAQFVRALVEGAYRCAEKVVLVMDQLNTHSAASLYEAIPPAEAKRIADRLEIHHTPKHGSWLNMAEIELRALSRQCLSRGIAKRETLALRSRAGPKNATNDDAASIGTSPPPTPASNSNDSIHRLAADGTLAYHVVWDFLQHAVPSPHALSPCRLTDRKRDIPALA
jgi:hypothetical protein